MSLTAYIEVAMASARVKMLEDKSYFGEILRQAGIDADDWVEKR